MFRVLIEVFVSKSILIVDDSPVMRKVLRATLEHQADWQVCGEASNGREGVEMVQKVKPDLVLLDLSMPVMNGLEAARELNQLFPSVPLVMFTNFETDHLKQEALSAGIKAVVSKDSVGAMLSSIQSLLEPVS